MFNLIVFLEIAGLEDPEKGFYFFFLKMLSEV